MVLTGPKIIGGLVVCSPTSHFTVAMMNHILKQNLPLQATWSQDLLRICIIHICEKHFTPDTVASFPLALSACRLVTDNEPQPGDCRHQHFTSV